MIVKTGTYYKTRGGDLAYVEYYFEASIWHYRGKIFKDEDVTDQSWTEFGGVSGDYNLKDWKERYIEDDDLVEHLSKETHPEYYL